MDNSIADLAIRIKNGYMAKKEIINIGYSKTNEQIISLLKNEGYIKDFNLEINGSRKTLVVKLMYDHGKPAMMSIEAVSKPGSRIYSRSKYLKPILGGLGRAILTTSKGIMTDIDAKKNGLGGEVLFKIW